MDMSLGFTDRRQHMGDSFSQLSPHGHPRNIIWSFRVDPGDCQRFNVHEVRSGVGLTLTRC